LQTYDGSAVLEGRFEVDGVWLLTPDGMDDGDFEADGDCEGRDIADGDWLLDGADDDFESRHEDEQKGPPSPSLGESRKVHPENPKMLLAIPYGNDSPHAHKF